MHRPFRAIELCRRRRARRANENREKTEEKNVYLNVKQMICVLHCRSLDSNLIKFTVMTLRAIACVLAIHSLHYFFFSNFNNGFYGLFQQLALTVIVRSSLAAI